MMQTENNPMQFAGRSGKRSLLEVLREKYGDQYIFEPVYDDKVVENANIPGEIIAANTVSKNPGTACIKCKYDIPHYTNKRNARHEIALNRIHQRRISHSRSILRKW